MPYIAYTPYRADEWTFAGASGLAHGIGGAASQLGAAIERATERRRQEATLAQSLRGKLGVIYPDRKDEFKAAGLPELVRLDAQHSQEVLGKQLQLDEQLKQERLANQQYQRQQFERAPAFFQRLSEAGQAPETVPAPLSNAEFGRRTAPLGPGTIFEAAGATGYNPAGMTDDLLRSLRSNEADLTKPEFTDIPGTESTLVRLGKWAQAVPKTSGVPSSEELMDEEGKPLGHVIRMPGAKPQFKPNKPVGAKVRIRINPDDPYDTSYAEMDFDEYERRYGKVKRGGPEGARPLPLPKTKAELKKDQIYQTERGLAKWTGTQFESVAQ